ncbi:unnamed protein product [Prunus armeniaca]
MKTLTWKYKESVEHRWNSQEASNNVEIHHSRISAGDDCTSLGDGRHDVDIMNVTCGPSHGISIGSLGRDKSEACVKNITVRDSVIKQSDNGLRIKPCQGGSGAVSKINFNNIEMDKVQLPPAAAQGDGELNFEPPFCWKAYGIIETRVTRPLRSCMMDSNKIKTVEQLTGKQMQYYGGRIKPRISGA